MTMKQEAMRADFRALMTASGLPDYADDKNATQRVGNVIGKSAGHEERHIRSSDSRGRLTVDSCRMNTTTTVLTPGFGRSYCARR